MAASLPRATHVVVMPCRSMPAAMASYWLPSVWPSVSTTTCLTARLHGTDGPIAFGHARLHVGAAAGHRAGRSGGQCDRPRLTCCIGTIQCGLGSRRPPRRPNPSGPASSPRQSPPPCSFPASRRLIEPEWSITSASAPVGTTFTFFTEKSTRHGLFDVGVGPAAGAETAGAAQHHQAAPQVLGVAGQQGRSARR